MTDIRVGDFVDVDEDPYFWEVVECRPESDEYDIRSTDPEDGRVFTVPGTSLTFDKTSTPCDRYWTLENCFAAAMEDEPVIMDPAPEVPLVCDDVDAILNERGQRYGTFVGHACIAQDLKTTLRKAPSWNAMQPDQKEALEMVCHKMARIVNGDPDYADSWIDIVGYATLVAERLDKGVTR